MLGSLKKDAHKKIELWLFGVSLTKQWGQEKVSGDGHFVKGLYDEKESTNRRLYS